MLGGELESKGNQEDSSAVVVPGFMVMGLVSGLSLVNHFDSGSFLVMCMAQSRWILTRGILGGWQDRWTDISSLLLSFPEFFWLVVACEFCVLYQDLLL